MCTGHAFDASQWHGALGSQWHGANGPVEDLATLERRRARSQEFVMGRVRCIQAVCKDAKRPDIPLFQIVGAQPTVPAGGALALVGLAVCDGLPLQVPGGAFGLDSAGPQLIVAALQEDVFSSIPQLGCSVLDQGAGRPRRDEQGLPLPAECGCTKGVVASWA